MKKSSLSIFLVRKMNINRKLSLLFSLHILLILSLAYQPLYGGTGYRSISTTSFDLYYPLELKKRALETGELLDQYLSLYEKRYHVHLPRSLTFLLSAESAEPQGLPKDFHRLLWRGSVRDIKKQVGIILEAEFQTVSGKGKIVSHEERKITLKIPGGTIYYHAGQRWIETRHRLFYLGYGDEENLLQGISLSSTGEPLALCSPGKLNCRCYRFIQGEWRTVGVLPGSRCGTPMAGEKGLMVPILTGGSWHLYKVTDHRVISVAASLYKGLAVYPDSGSSYYFKKEGFFYTLYLHHHGKGEKIFTWSWHPVNLKWSSNLSLLFIRAIAHGKSRWYSYSPSTGQLEKVAFPRDSPHFIGVSPEGYTFQVKGKKVTYGRDETVRTMVTSLIDINITHKKALTLVKKSSPGIPWISLSEITGYMSYSGNGESTLRYEGQTMDKRHTFIAQGGYIMSGFASGFHGYLGYNHESGNHGASFTMRYSAGGDIPGEVAPVLLLKEGISINTHELSFMGNYSYGFPFGLTFSLGLSSGFFISSQGVTGLTSGESTRWSFVTLHGSMTYSSGRARPGDMLSGLKARFIIQQGLPFARPLYGHTFLSLYGEKDFWLHPVHLFIKTHGDLLATGGSGCFIYPGRGGEMIPGVPSSETALSVVALDAGIIWDFYSLSSLSPGLCSRLTLSWELSGGIAWLTDLSENSRVYSHVTLGFQIRFSPVMLFKLDGAMAFDSSFNLVPHVRAYMKIDL